MSSEDLDSTKAGPSRFSVRLTTDQPDGGEFAWCIQALDIAISAGAWIDAALGRRESIVYSALESRPLPEKAAERFFPTFSSQPVSSALEFIAEMDPLDSLDVGVLFGLNAWLRQELSADPDLYEVAAAEVGAKAAQVAIGQFELNAAVADVDADD